MNPIYLDYNATTPIDPAVYAAMLPYLDSIPGSGVIGNFGKPNRPFTRHHGSTHFSGRFSLRDD